MVYDLDESHQNLYGCPAGTHRSHRLAASPIQDLPYCHLKPSDRELFLQEKPIVDYTSGIDPDSKRHIFAGERISSIPNCSPESYRIILNYLEDPNDKYVVLERAAWGDPNAKSPLSKLYQEYLITVKNQNPEIQTSQTSSTGTIDGKREGDGGWIQ